MWTSNQMIFGDGDEVIFNSFTLSVGITAHELTHRIVFATCGLVYKSQSGALNEHLADVFGMLTKHYQKELYRDTSDWRIGAELFKSSEALRNMKSPGTAYNNPGYGGKDPQPDHMNNYNTTAADNSGVHYNSVSPTRLSTPPAST